MSPAPPRLASVDALRGLTVAAMLLVNNPGDWGHVYAPLRHAVWHGCTPTDLIFPFFLFVVGVSVALGLVARAEAGAVAADLRRSVLSRAARIAALGLLLHLVAWWALGSEHYRPWGVLQRIGLCFLAAALLALYTRPRTQWLCVLVLLFGYWLLLAAGGTYERYDNVADRVDTALFGSWLYDFDTGSGRGHDPEGLLSTLPAIATTLLGVRAGAALRADRRAALWLAALLALGIGWAWSFLLPINKSLWTSSYVVWTGGWALIALLILHQLVDRLRLPPLGRRFGINAITAYAGSGFMVYALIASGCWGAIYRRAFADWMTPLFGPYLPSLAFALAFVVLWWLIVRAMDALGWRLRL